MGDEGGGEDEKEQENEPEKEKDEGGGEDEKEQENEPEKDKDEGGGEDSGKEDTEKEQDEGGGDDNDKRVTCNDKKTARAAEPMSSDCAAELSNAKQNKKLDDLYARCRTALDFRKRCPQICCKRGNEEGGKDSKKKEDSKKKKDSKEDSKEDSKKDGKQKNTSQDKGVTCSASLLGKPNQNDCVAEKNNAVRNGQLDALYNRCRTEGGSRPIRVRCPQLCCKNWGEKNDGKKSGKKKNAGSALLLAGGRRG